MIKIKFVVIFVVFSNYNISAQVSQKTPKSIKESYIKVDRSPCYGRCPYYSITLNKTGELTLEGKQHIKLIGRYSKKLNQEKTDSIFKVFKIQKFYKLKKEYISQATDFPTTNITYVFKGKMKKVKAYGPAPSLVGMIESIFHTLATDTLDWQLKQ